MQLDQRAIRRAGELLRFLRELNGYTLGEASEHLRIDPTKLERLEDGKDELTAPLIRPIAKLYLVEPDFLFLPFRGVGKTDQASV